MISNSPSPRFISSTLLLGAFSVFSMVLGLIGTVIITRRFSTEDFGVYILVLVIATFLGQISTFGLELSVSRFIAGAKDERGKEHFFSTAVIVRICSVFLTSLLALCGIPLIKILFGQSLLPGFIFYILLLFAVESIRALLKSTLQGCLLFFKMGIVDLIASFVNLIFVVLIYMLKENINLLIFAKVFSSFLACVFAFVSIPIRKRISFQMDAFKQLMKFGYPLQLNDILGFIYNRVDTVAVAIFLGPAEIAIYEVARKIPDYLRNLYEPFRSVYYPFISKHYALEGRQKASEHMNDAVRFVAFATLLGVVIATLFGREILQLVFTEKYSSSAPIFILLMINLSIALISNVMGTTLVAVGDSQKPVIINFVNAIASWLGSILLIPPFSLVGASVANTIGTAAAFPLNWYFLRKRIELRDRVYLKPIMVFLGWSLLFYLIRPELLLMKLAFLIAFVLACISLSIVTKEDVVLLLEGSGLSSWRPLMKLTMWVSKL